MKIVFMNIVDGINEDYQNLKHILNSLSKNSDYEFVIAPKRVQSVSLDDIKKLIERFENDEHEGSEKASE